MASGVERRNYRAVLIGSLVADIQKKTTWKTFAQLYEPMQPFGVTLQSGEWSPETKL